jgi:hypothetical protein
MKFGVSDLSTERQCRAAIGMDKERFYKLLVGFKKSYLEICPLPTTKNGLN